MCNLGKNNQSICPIGAQNACTEHRKNLIPSDCTFFFLESISQEQQARYDTIEEMGEIKEK